MKTSCSICITVLPTNLHELFVLTAQHVSHWTFNKKLTVMYTVKNLSQSLKADFRLP